MKMKMKATIHLPGVTGGPGITMNKLLLTFAMCLVLSALALAQGDPSERLLHAGHQHEFGELSQ